MSRRRWLLPTGVVGIGTAATASIAAAGHLPAGDAAVLVLYAAGAATLAVLAAAAVLAGTRRRSVVLQAAVAALAPVLAVGIGVAAAASAMFISTHDLHALLVVLAAAGTVGVLSGLLLGRRVATAGRSLGVMARTLGRPCVVAGDLGVRKAVSAFYAGGRPLSTEEVRAMGDRFEPFQNLAAHYLLTAARRLL